MAQGTTIVAFVVLLSAVSGRHVNRRQTDFFSQVTEGTKPYTSGNFPQPTMPSGMGSFPGTGGGDGGSSAASGAAAAASDRPYRQVDYFNQFSESTKPYTSGNFPQPTMPSGMGSFPGTGGGDGGSSAASGAAAAASDRPYRQVDYFNQFSESTKPYTSGNFPQPTMPSGMGSFPGTGGGDGGSSAASGAAAAASDRPYRQVDYFNQLSGNFPQPPPMPSGMGSFPGTGGGDGGSSAASGAAAAASDRPARQAEYINQFNEGTKPYTGNFPQPPPMPSGMGNFPGMGGGDGGSSAASGAAAAASDRPARQAEYINQFNEGTKPYTGNFPQPPPMPSGMGNFPGMGGGDGGSSAASGAAAAASDRPARQAEYFNQINEGTKPYTGNFPQPTMPSGMGNFPGMGGGDGGSSAASSSAAAASDRPARQAEYINQFNEGTKPYTGNFPQPPPMPSGMGNFPGMGGGDGGSSAASGAAAAASDRPARRM